MNKIFISLIIILSIVFIAYATDDIQVDKKITTPQINLYLNINDNNGIYTISVDGKECISKNPIKLNTINYGITNIAGVKDIKNIDAFTFSVSNSTQQKYMNKEISLDFMLYGSGYIINNEVKK